MPKKAAPIGFINMPYDKEYENILLAYISGLAAFGIVPYLAPHDTRAAAQLDRIVHNIEISDYSIHDMSCMGLSSSTPLTPRFNMPLELGMAITESEKRKTAFPMISRRGTGNSRIVAEHHWIVFEKEDYRLEKACSDLKGYPYFSYGTDKQKAPKIILSKFMSALVRPNYNPELKDLESIYEAVHKKARTLKPHYKFLFERK
jgi:hypothetical protein